GASHRAPGRKSVGVVTGGSHVPIRRAETGNDEEVAAVAEKLGDDGAAVQQAALRDHRGRASSLKFLAPSTPWPMRTATARHVLKARFAAPSTAGATRRGSSARWTITPIASSAACVPCPIGTCQGLNS